MKIDKLNFIKNLFNKRTKFIKEVDLNNFINLQFDYGDSGYNN